MSQPSVNHLTTATNPRMPQSTNCGTNAVPLVSLEARGRHQNISSLIGLTGQNVVSLVTRGYRRGGRPVHTL